jgi:hypothetical protein
MILPFAEARGNIADEREALSEAERIYRSLGSLKAPIIRQRSQHVYTSAAKS